MPRCPHCHGPLPSRRDRVGARCPSCSQPLDEPVRDPHQPASAVAATCPVHAANPAIGTCARCGNYLCSVCRTRWADQPMCVACIERAMEETPPADTQLHGRQALLALLFGLCAWLTAALALLLIFTSIKGGVAGNVFNFILGLLFLLLSPLPATLGLGQGTAALRTRGDHMILATLGLILSGLEAGMVVGILSSLVIWLNNN